MTTRVAVVGRNANQAVNARFRLQPAIGVVALDEQGRGLDARFFAIMDFQKLDLEALDARPSGCTCAEACWPSPGFPCRRRRNGLPDRCRCRRLRQTASLRPGGAQLRPSSAFRASSASLTTPSSPSSSPISMSSILSFSCCSELPCTPLMPSSSCWRSRISFCAS